MRLTVKMQTRSTRANQHARLLSRVDSHSPKTEFCTEVAVLVKQVLDEHGPDEVPDPEDIIDRVRDALPSPRMVLTEEFFQAPMFPIVILKDVLSFYETDPSTDDFLSDLELSERDKNNRNMKCFIWFAALISLDKEETLKFVEQVRFNRGLTNIPGNGSSSMETQIQLGNPVNAGIYGAPADVPPTSPKTPTRATPSVFGIAPVQADPVVPAIGSISSLFPVPVPGKDSAPATVPVPGLGSTPDDPNPTSHVANRPQNNHDDMAKKALSVHQYFKGDRSSGEIHECIGDKIQDYHVCSMQLEAASNRKFVLTQSRRLLYSLMSLKETPADSFSAMLSLKCLSNSSRR